MRAQLHGFSALWWLVGFGWLPLEEHPPTLVEVARRAGIRRVETVGVHVAGPAERRIGLYAGPWVWFLGREPWNTIARARAELDRLHGTSAKNHESSEHRETTRLNVAVCL